ncbi:MAG: hypothetical protein D4S01_06825 [Dehalococcoidia bacterium]|nr:MAG: hypothetical protein D4S01_06825 [Dehalococcoidia bacterium]
MKYVWKATEVVNGWSGKPIHIPKQEDPDDEKSAIVTADATICDIMQLLVSNAQYKTIEDSKEGRRLAEALEEAKKSKVIEIDQGTHNWLKKQSEMIAPQIFRISGEIVDNLIRDGWKKENLPKSKE